MEYLKRHTVKEFEQMTEEVYDAYMETLGDLCCELGINVGGYTTAFGSGMAMEDAVMKLLEQVQTPKKKSKGIKLDQMPNWNKNVIWKANKHIDKCRKVLIDIIKHYIGYESLSIGKTLKQSDCWGETYAFTEICCMRYEDEIEYLCPDKNDTFPDESSWMKLEDVTIENLLKIISLIQDCKATIYTQSDQLDDNYIKEKILNSGLVTEI